MNALGGTRGVKELCNLVWFSTWSGKYFKKYLERSMGRFRTTCLMLRSLILMPGMALLQPCHPQQLHFVLDCCHYPCPSPSASQAVTLGKQGGSLCRASTLASSHHRWRWLWDRHLLPTLSQQHVDHTLGFRFSPDSVHLLLYYTFYHPERCFLCNFHSNFAFNICN